MSGRGASIACDTSVNVHGAALLEARLICGLSVTLVKPSGLGQVKTVFDDTKHKS